MGRGNRALKNSSISLLSQISSLFITLITRKFFLVYLGVELLGLSSTFTSILSTLSLTELGFETAVIYHLYKPLADRDFGRVGSIIAVFRKVYQFVAIFLAIASVIFLFFLDSVINGIEITKYVYLFFLLQAANSVVSYLLAYKRTLIYADQKEYIIQICDLACNVVFSILRIVSIVWIRSFTVYLILQIGQTVASNLIIHLKCRQIYPGLDVGHFDKTVFFEIFNNVKHVIGSKIAFFINNSTDNLVISVFIGTVQVGFFTNYTTVTLALKKVVTSFFRPLAPFIGELLVDKTISYKKREQILLLYSHVGFIISLGVLVPTAVLLNDFIGGVYGMDFVLGKNIVLLMVFDLYINFVHRVCCDYINGGGLFKYDKYIEFIGAAINIAISVILANRFEIIGVLIGTVLSGLFFWIGRSAVVYKCCIYASLKQYVIYWLKNAIYILVFTVAFVCCNIIYSKLPSNMVFVFKFILGGCLCELITFAVYALFLGGTNENKILMDKARSFILRDMGNKM